jgi:hypothetical protein
LVERVRAMRNPNLATSHEYWGVAGSRRRVNTHRHVLISAAPSRCIPLSFTDGCDATSNRHAARRASTWHTRGTVRGAPPCTCDTHALHCRPTHASRAHPDRNTCDSVPRILDPPTLWICQPAESHILFVASVPPSDRRSSALQWPVVRF